MFENRFIYLCKKQCQLVGWLVGWQSFTVEGLCVLCDNVYESVCHIHCHVTVIIWF
jgi:hypothetical protein